MQEAKKMRVGSLPDGARCSLSFQLRPPAALLICRSFSLVKLDWPRTTPSPLVYFPGTPSADSSVSASTHVRGSRTSTTNTPTFGGLAILAAPFALPWVKFGRKKADSPGVICAVQSKVRRFGFGFTVGRGCSF